MPTSFDRIVGAERPLTTTLALVGVGFALSLLAGLAAGWLAADFRSTFGWTVSAGLMVTSVLIIALLAPATARQQRR